MKKTFDDYTWLAGSHGARGSLWLGKEHLLVIEGRGWVLPLSEVYRRVDYANIQALSIAPTAAYLWIAVAAGLGAALFGLLTALTWREQPFFPISLGLPAVLLAIIFVVHLLKGRTCTCSLQTAVQVLRLRPLNRMRLALPAMERLEALCRQHQGAMPDAEALARSAAPLPPMAAPVAGVKPPWAGSRWVLGTGLAALLWGLLLAGELFVDGLPFTMANLFCGAVAVTLGVIALVRAYRMRVPGFLALSLWSLPTGGIAAAIALYGMAIAAVLKHNLDGFVTRGRSRSNADQLLAALAQFRFDETKGLGWTLVGLGLLIGIAGLTMIAYGPQRGLVSSANTAPAPAAAPPPPPLA